MQAQISVGTASTGNGRQVASFGGAGAPAATAAAAAAAATSSSSNNGGVVAFVHPRNPPEGRGLAGFIDTVTQSRDMSQLFWKPDPAKAECGLLEALVRRGGPGYGGAHTGSASDFKLLASRPVLELCNNFSNARGERVDLSHPRFQLSRPSQAMQNLSKLPADGYTHNSVIRDNLQAGVKHMLEDEVFLVKYRDYSDFAVKRWPDEAKRDRVLSPSYVERCFAVKVGRDAGVLIPITEVQFERGYDKLHEVNISVDAVSTGTVRASLTLTEFDALPKPADGGAPPTYGKTADDDLDLQEEPSAFDWSAKACDIRYRRFRRHYYYHLGRYTFKIGVVCLAAVYIKYRYFPSQAQPQQIAGRRSGGGNGNGNGGRGRSNGQIVRDIVSLPITVLGSALLGRRGDDDE